MQTDASTHVTTTVVANPGGLPDSLAFAPNGDIVYTINDPSSRIGIWDGTTVSTFALGASVRDLTLAPDGLSVYVGDAGNGSIYKFDLATHMATTFKTGLGLVDGLAFGSNGNLYVVDQNETQVQELDGTTGNILATSAPRGGLDGMTFDSSTNKIWVAYKNINGLLDCDLSLTCGGDAVNEFATPDGIAAEGNGNIYVANFLGSISKYNIAGNSSSVVANTPGIDDLAPVSGLGSQVPEPGSVVLLGTCALGLVNLIRKRQSRT